MKTVFHRFIVGVILTFTALPWVLLAFAGLRWLWQEQWMFAWLGIVVAASLVSWLAARRYRAKLIRRPVPESLRAEPDQNWSQTQKEAWKSVESICERIETEKPVLDEWNAYMALFRETVERVAAHFHPDQPYPFLEMRVPDLLRIVELLSHDLRVLTTEHVPASHIVTIGDVMKAHGGVSRLKKVYDWYRLAIFSVAPVNAVVNEIRHRLSGETASLVYNELKRYLICACVRKAGFYAIRLYSGELDFDTEQLQSYVSAASEEDRRLTGKMDREMLREPLRIAVVGQTNSGKSSLINHLFGELRTAVDVVPTTPGVRPFVLEGHGLPEAIVIDTGGYEDGSGRNRIQPIEEVLDSADLVILVCIANRPSHDPDKILLQSMRERCRVRNQECPECIVALTHIDQLRPFREWSPPYRLDPPEGSKAQSIAAATQAAAKGLGLRTDQFVPVNLADGYNVREALIPAILNVLPEVRRHQYLRCLKAFHDEKGWDRIWKQSLGAGRLLAAAGSDWLRRRWGRNQT